MTTAKERAALLEYVAWHGGKAIADARHFNVWHAIELLPSIHDEPNNRPAIAESLAYDGTDGP